MAGPRQRTQYLGSDSKPVVTKPAGSKSKKTQEKGVKKDQANATGTETLTPIAESVNQAVHNGPVNGATTTAPEVTPAPGVVNEDPQTPGAEGKQSIQMDFKKLVVNPKETLTIFEAALKSDTLTDEDRMMIESFSPVIQRMVELENAASAVQTQTATTEIKEKAMTTTTVKTQEQIEAEQKALALAGGVNTLTANGEGTSVWIPTLLAAGAAAVTTGFDMVANDDLSKTRIIGTVAAAVVAAGAQQVVQRNWTDDQGTGINCGIAAGIGLVTGGASRVLVNMYNEHAASDVTEL